MDIELPLTMLNKSYNIQQLVMRNLPPHSPSQAAWRQTGQAGAKVSRWIVAEKTC
jgi:hypothetical protein